MPTATAPIPFCHKNLDVILTSGLFTPERLAEIQKEVEEGITEVRLEGGVLIPNARVVITPRGPEIFPINHDGALDFARRSRLGAVLTPAELVLVNEQAQAEAFKFQENERYTGAKKIAMADYDQDQVFTADDSLISVSDLLLEKCHVAADGTRFVWACVRKTILGKLMVSDVVESDLISNGWEDMSASDLNGTQELQKALDAFVAANSDVHVFNPDYRTAVIVAPCPQSA